MKIRIITAIVAAAVFIPILIFSYTWVFPCAMAFGCVLGCLEMISCAGQKKNLWLIIPISLFAALAPIGVRYFYKNGAMISFNMSFNEFLKLAVCVAIVLTIYILGVAVFANKTLPITDAAMIIAGCLYIISAFSAIVYIRDYVMHGKFVYLLIFFAAWMSDSFAYFTGRLFGKHKLIPTVSPKKTVEGAIGGIVFGVLTTVAFGFVIETFFDPEGVIKANYLSLAISGIFLSVVSQIGDLIMSLIKRHYNIKDYGKFLPGHGGILDRFDSIIAVSLVMAVICTYFNFFA